PLPTRRSSDLKPGHTAHGRTLEFATRPITTSDADGPRSPCAKLGWMLVVAGAEVTSLGGNLWGRKTVRLESLTHVRASRLCKVISSASANEVGRHIAKLAHSDPSS